jgi:hypothetical protein
MIKVKKNLLVPHIRKIKAKQPLLLKELIYMEAKRTQLIPEKKKDGSEKKTGLKQSKQNFSKTWQNRETRGLFTVTAHHPEA